MMKYVKGLKYRTGLTTSGIAFGRYKIGCRKNPTAVAIGNTKPIVAAS